MLSEEEIEKAVRYLSSSSEQYALAKANMKYLEHKRKSVRAVISLRQKGKSQAENGTRAEASEEYQGLLEELKDSIATFTIIDAKRHAAEIWVETWRTQEASKRRGNV